MGYGLVILSIRVTVVRYFPVNYFIAASIMLSGGGVGMMVLPLLTEFLIGVYGWRGALLLIGGLNLQTMVAGALLRPSSTDRTHESTPLTSNPSINHGPTYSSLASDDDGDENTLSPADTRQKYDPTSNNSPTRKEDLPGTSSSSYHSEELMEEQAPSGVWTNIKHGFIQMVQILDFRIFCDYPMFSLTLVAIFLHGITYTGWIVFLVPNAIAKGFSSYTAVSLAAIGGELFKKDASSAVIVPPYLSL